MVHLTHSLVPQLGGDPEQGVGEPGYPDGGGEGHEAGAGGPGAPHHLAVLQAAPAAAGQVRRGQHPLLAVLVLCGGGRRALLLHQVASRALLVVAAGPEVVGQLIVKGHIYIYIDI